MIINKTKNAARNIVFGSLLKIYQILLPFAFRTIMVYTLGIQYLGLNSLFTSVLQVLNLAELGVGSAMVFSMYKPIAEDDKTMICALMNLYRIYYRVIGAFIAGVGLLLTPAIPKLISGDVPDDINIYVLYFLNLGATVLTYWLFAYKNSVLQAHQRQDVVSKVTLFTDTFKYALQLAALLLFANYYFYVIAILFSQVLNNCITAFIAYKKYPNYKPQGRLNKEAIRVINRRVLDLFTARIGGTVLGAADTIVISAFLGLEILAIYQNYFYILNAVMSFIIIINQSVVAGVGNSMLTKSKEKNYQEFKVFSFVEFWIIGFCMCCFSSMYQPFMKLWMGEKNLFPYPIVLLFCLYFLGYEIEKMFTTYKDAGGIWHEDRFRPLIFGTANLIMNLILVKPLGIYGVVLSTLLSIFLISIPWIIRNVFHLVFEVKTKEYVITLIKYIGVIILCMLVVNLISRFIHFNAVIDLLLIFVVNVVIANSLFYLFFRRSTEFAEMARIVKKIIHRKAL